MITSFKKNNFELSSNLELIKNICDLEKNNMKYFWNIDQWISFLESRDFYLILNIHNEKVVSVCLFDISDVDTSHLVKIFTNKLERGKGHASEIFEFALSSLNSRNVYLEVEQDNTNAIGFYERYGFKQIHLKKKFYSDGLNALIMTRGN